MTLLLAFLLLLVTVPVAGGRLSRLSELRIRGIWLGVLAFGIQVLLVTVVPSGNETLHRLAHLATYGLVAGCILRNLDIRFMWMVAAGGVLNYIAIAANGGVMPPTPISFVTPTSAFSATSSPSLRAGRGRMCSASGTPLWSWERSWCCTRRRVPGSLPGNVRKASRRRHVKKASGREAHRPTTCEGRPG
jgi:hypothetical protein